MIAQTPVHLMISLAIVSLLALVVGYCVALLRTKYVVRQFMENAQNELYQQQLKSEADLGISRDHVSVLKTSLREQAQKAQASREREMAMGNHSQLQAQRIQTLEAQCAAYEEQQIRVQRDFATYKSNKKRELEVVRGSQEPVSAENEPPLLSRKADTAIQKDPADSADPTHATVAVKAEARKNSLDLSKPLSRELEIPALAESELPDSVDDLEFEMSDSDDGGV